jgi:hypothetical protein
MERLSRYGVKTFADGTDCDGVLVGSLPAAAGWRAELAHGIVS